MTTPYLRFGYQAFSCDTDTVLLFPSHADAVECATGTRRGFRRSHPDEVTKVRVIPRNVRVANVSIPLYAVVISKPQRKTP
tara:strand:- start:20 stop:262 length:243 start_codon:yes stop_codon:yes gene_type:complete